AIFVLLALIATLVIACGGGSSTPTPAGESTSTAQETPTAGESTSTVQESPTAGETPTETPSDGAPSGETGSRNYIYGFNVFARGDDQGAEFNEQVIDMVTGAGFDWVRIQIEWSQFERAKGQWDPLP